MKIISFELTMPSNNSWNGKWTGAEKKYYIIKRLSERSTENLLANGDYYTHNFGDGWMAAVRVEIIDSKESAKRKKLSSGFCGYDWMVNSLIYSGSINYERRYA